MRKSRNPLPVRSPAAALRRPLHREVGAVRERHVVPDGQLADLLDGFGTAAGHVEGARQYVTRAVANDTIVIHGSKDTTVPLANVLAWAEPLDLPVVVIPGADHFFHRRLNIIRDVVTRAWRH